MLGSERVTQSSTEKYNVVHVIQLLMLQTPTKLNVAEILETAKLSYETLEEIRAQCHEKKTEEIEKYVSP